MPMGHGGVVVIHRLPASGFFLVQTPGPMGKVGSCLLMVGSLQYRILTNCMYWFPLPIKLHVVLQIQC